MSRIRHRSDRRRRHRPRGHARSPQGARRRRRRVRLQHAPHRVPLRHRPLPEDQGDLPRARPSRRSSRSTRSSSARSAIRARRSGCSSTASSPRCASSSTCTSTCGRSSSTTSALPAQGQDARGRRHGRSCARTPRTPTSAPTASRTRASPTRSRRRPWSTRARASSASIRYAFELARARDKRKQLTLIDKANAVRAQDLWTRTFAEVATRVPRHQDRPRLHRRGLHVDGQEPRVVRRGRDAPTCSATSSPTSARWCRAAWASPPRATSTPARSRCSSRSTARRPSTPARTWPRPVAAIMAGQHDARLPRREAGREQRSRTPWPSSCAPSA